jgi:hypothetical protein
MLSGIFADSARYCLVRLLLRTSNRWYAISNLGSYKNEVGDDGLATAMKALCSLFTENEDRAHCHRKIGAFSDRYFRRAVASKSWHITTAPTCGSDSFPTFLGYLINNYELLLPERIDNDDKGNFG